MRIDSHLEQAGRFSIKMDLATSTTTEQQQHKQHPSNPSFALIQLRIGFIYDYSPFLKRRQANAAASREY